MIHPIRPTELPPLELDRWRDDEEDPSAPSDMAAVFLVLGCLLALSWAAYWGLT